MTDETRSRASHYVETFGPLYRPLGHRPELDVKLARAQAGVALTVPSASQDPPVALKIGYHQTLSEVLTALGWRHERPDPERHARLPGHRAIFEADGTPIGLLDVFECWAMLRRRGLIAPAGDDAP